MACPMAMNANSGNKEAAWSFLRTVLLPESQPIPNIWDDNNDIVGMPTNKAKYDAAVQLALNPPEGTGLFDPNESLLSDPAVPTQADADELWELICGTTVVERSDEAIAAIIRDEAARFFAGQQTAEAAAKAVQSRVNLYLGERR